MPLPQFAIRSYGGGAATAQLVQQMGSTDITFTITPTTGWVENGTGVPLGTSGLFTVVIDRQANSEEKIQCSGINLATGLVNVYVAVDGTTGRGYDGTTAQAHVPGGTTSGVQPCLSSTEIQEMNQAVYALLGTGGSSSLGVPLGTMIDFTGTPLSLPTNFLVADGSAISRSAYSALFTATTVATTGTTSTGGSTITSVSNTITPYLHAGMQVTLANSAGAIYTVSSVSSTAIVLTSGVGITAGSGSVVVYPHGAGNGSTTFNLPDSRGRGTRGQGVVGSPSQPSTYVGITGGNQSATIGTGNMPADPGHGHLLYVDPSIGGGSTSTALMYTIPGAGSQIVTYSGANVQNDLASTGHGTNFNILNWSFNAASDIKQNTTGLSSGANSPLNIDSPYLGVTKIVRVL